MYVIDVFRHTSLPVHRRRPAATRARTTRVSNTTLDCELLAVQKDLNARRSRTAPWPRSGSSASAARCWAQPPDAQILDDNAPGRQPDRAERERQTPPSPFPFRVPAPTSDVQRVLPRPYIDRALASAFIGGWPFSTPLGSGFDLFTRKAVGSGTNYWAAIKRLKFVLSNPSVASIPNKIASSSRTATRPSGGPTSLAAALSFIPVGQRRADRHVRDRERRGLLDDVDLRRPRGHLQRARATRCISRLRPTRPPSSRARSPRS